MVLKVHEIPAFLITKPQYKNVLIPLAFKLLFQESYILIIFPSPRQKSRFWKKPERPQPLKSLESKEKNPRLIYLAVSKHFTKLKYTIYLAAV